MSYVTRSGNQFRLDGNRFRFIGFNYYPFIVDSTAQTTVQNLFNAAKAKGITVFRTWCFDRGYMPSNSAGNFRYLSGTTLLWREATFAQLDMVLDEARQRGIKLILSFGDNPTYNTKNTYIRWSDAIYGTDYFTPVSKSIASASLASNTITVTTSAAHGFQVGQIVNTSGANEAIFNNTAAFIRTVPSSTTFTYAKTGSDQSATGTMSVIRNSSYKSQNFWRDANCKQMYKDFFSQLANRVNTINGRTYKNDDTIFAWEMFNEGRYDQDNDPGINGTGSHNLSVISGMNGNVPNAYQYATGWAEEMADYFKSIDTNHLVTYGSMAHTWQWTNGDTISNGTYYGVDYNYLSQISNIDYLDFHIYPTQGDNVNLQKYGQRLGYPNEITGAGFTAQLQDFVNVGHTNGKPVICSEIGFIRENIQSNTHYHLAPRHEAYRSIFKDFLTDGDGDGMILWSASLTDGGTYSHGLNETGTTNYYGTNANSNDATLMQIINNLNTQLVDSGKRPRVI